jgi:peptidoglycan hydrolase-like protein with peptidoglycan-binding domain
MIVDHQQPSGKEKSMQKLLATLTLAVLIIAPMAAIAAGDNTPGKSPAAVDQLLAKDVIQQAQMHLKVAGFNPGRTDGVFDVKTADAIRQYQTVNGIPASGLLDAPTRQVLLAGFQDGHED